MTNCLPNTEKLSSNLILDISFIHTIPGSPNEHGPCHRNSTTKRVTESGSRNGLGPALGPRIIRNSTPFSSVDTRSLIITLTVYIQTNVYKNECVRVYEMAFPTRHAQT